MNMKTRNPLRRTLALMLSLALLTGTICCGGLTLTMAASNVASITFGDGTYTANNMTVTYYDAQSGADEAKVRVHSGAIPASAYATAPGTTEYALDFGIINNEAVNNQSLNMVIPDGTFTEGATVTATVTYMFQYMAGDYTNRLGDDMNIGQHFLELNGVDAYANRDPYAANGQMETLTTTYDAADLNGQTARLIYANSGCEVLTGAYVVSVVFTEQEILHTLNLSETVTGGTAVNTGSGNAVNAVATAAEGYEFTGWYDGAADTAALLSDQNPYIFTMEADTTLVPRFTATQLLTVTTDGHGTATMASGHYVAGTPVDLTATPDAGYLFTDWFDGETSVSDTPSFTYTTTDEGVTLTARFRAHYTLTLNDATPAGTGTASATYADGDTYTLTATPADGYTFAGWRRSNNTLFSASSITLTADTVLTPVFAESDRSVLNTLVNQRIDWLVGYTPASRDAYTAALLAAETALSGADEAAVAAALTGLRTAQAGLTAATAETKGYASVDYTVGTDTNPVRVNATSDFGNNAAIVTDPLNNYSLLMDAQNNWSGIHIAADAFAPDDYVKVTFHYYFTAPEDAVLEGERMQVSYPGLTGTEDQRILFQYGTEAWTQDAPAQMTFYIDDISDFSNGSWRLFIERFLQNNGGEGIVDRNLYIEAVELEAVTPDNPATVTVAASPADSGTATVSGVISGVFRRGTTRTFKAVPARGYTFDRWTADAAVTFENATTLTSATADIALPADAQTLAVTAHFAPMTGYAVTLNATAGGTATSHNELGDTHAVYYPNETVTATATADTGYVFLSWSDGETDQTRTFANLSDAVSLTATFAPIVTANMVFVDYDGGAELAQGSNIVTLPVGGSVRPVVNTTGDDGMVLQGGKRTVRLDVTYYLTPYETGTGTDSATLTVTRDGVAANESLLNEERDVTVTDGVPADNGVLRTISVTVEDFDPSADTLMLTYASGTVMNVTKAVLTQVDARNRYLSYVPNPDVIVLPVKLLDFVPNGMMFEGGVEYNLTPADVYNYAVSIGDTTMSSATDTLLAEQLHDGHIVYKPIVVSYLMSTLGGDDEFYGQHITNFDGTGTTTVNPGSGEAVWVALIDRIEELRSLGRTGSWEQTLAKLGGQNGALMRLYNDGTNVPYAETLYDVAYYMLNTLFVSDPDYNKEVAQLNSLELKSAGNGWYVFDSGYDSDYDTTTGIIRNIGTVSPTYTPLKDSNRAAETQFFPLDGLGYGDTVERTDIVGGLGDSNFGFTMHGSGLFVYHKGENQQFYFTGDDDVWLFINGVNVLSLDGLHSRESAEISLDEIAAAANLLDGVAYSFDFFFMERHTDESNLKLYTNIEFLEPSADVEKNAYKSETYGAGTSYADVDSATPFTTVYYEFVLLNTGTVQFTDVRFDDLVLDITLTPDSTAFKMNALTQVSDLKFILEPNPAILATGTTTTYSFRQMGFSDETEEAYEQRLKQMLHDGIFPGYILRVQGIRHLLTADIDNRVNVTANYIDDGEIKTFVGQASQEMKVTSWNYALSVDYSVPLSVATAFEGKAKDANGLDENNAAIIKSFHSGDRYIGAYGTLTVGDGNLVTYALDREMTGVDSFVCTESVTIQGEVFTFEKTVSFVPANNVYYEATFVSGNMGRTNNGVNWETVSDTDTPHATITYDENSNVFGHGGNADFADIRGYSNGTALMGTGAVDSTAPATVTEFNFTGTGVDIYSRTDHTTGGIVVVLYRINEDNSETITKIQMADCQYRSGESDGELYQIPVVGIKELPYANYHVRITVYPQGNTFTPGRSVFYLDGVRVYKPLGDTLTSSVATQVYTGEEEMNARFISLREQLLTDFRSGNDRTGGAIYFDYKDPEEGEEPIEVPDHNCSISNYENYGPKNEVYLAPGHSIAFTVSGAYTGIQVSAKMANGTAGTFAVNGGADIAVSSSMDMYYKLALNDGNTYTLTNTSAAGSGCILSLTELKLTNTQVAQNGSGGSENAGAALVVTDDTAAYATALLNGDTAAANAAAQRLSEQAGVRYTATGTGMVQQIASKPNYEAATIA